MSVLRYLQSLLNTVCTGSLLEQNVSDSIWFKCVVFLYQPGNFLLLPASLKELSTLLLVSEYKIWRFPAPVKCLTVAAYQVSPCFRQGVLRRAI
jgi:hypothetical protein